MDRFPPRSALNDGPALSGLGASSSLGSAPPPLRLLQRWTPPSAMAAAGIAAPRSWRQRLRELLQGPSA